MRRRLLAYVAAALLNLAIVGGTLPVRDVVRIPIVRLQRREGDSGGFHPGELTAGGLVLVRPYRVNRFTINAN